MPNSSNCTGGKITWSKYQKSDIHTITLVAKLLSENIKNSAFIMVAKHMA